MLLGLLFLSLCNSLPSPAMSSLTAKLSPSSVLNAHSHDQVGCQEAFVLQRGSDAVAQLPLKEFHNHGEVALRDVVSGHSAVG